MSLKSGHYPLAGRGLTFRTLLTWVVRNLRNGQRPFAFEIRDTAGLNTHRPSYGEPLSPRRSKIGAANIRDVSVDRIQASYGKVRSNLPHSVLAIT